MRRDYQLIVLAEVVPDFRTTGELRGIFELAADCLAPGGQLVFNAFLARQGYIPDDAARELQALGISAVPSWNAAQLANDVHLRARGTIVDLEVDGAPRAVVGSLVRFSKSSCGLRSGTPALGEHNDYVFGDLLGISRDKRRLLERERVIY